MEAIRQAKEATATDLGWLLDARDGAVVTLVAGDTHLLAHRAVLSDRSPVFGAKFRRDMPEASGSSVTISDVEGPVLRQLVAYLYNLQAPQLPGTAHKLLAAADRYGLPGLKEACERQVAAQLTVETAAAAAVLAVRHGCSSLREDAIAFMKSHLVEVMATRGYADAVRTQPEDVVEVGRLLSETSPPAAAGSGTSHTPAPQPLSGRSQTPASASAAPPTAAAQRGSPHDEAADSRVRRPAAVDSGTSPAAAPRPLGDHSSCCQTPASAAPPTDAAHRGSPRDETSDSRLRRPAPVDSGTFPTSATQPLGERSGCRQTPASAAPPTDAAHYGGPHDEAAGSCVRRPAAVDSGTSPTDAPQPLSDHGSPQDEAADSRVSPAPTASAARHSAVDHGDCSHTPASAGASRLRSVSVRRTSSFLATQLHSDGSRTSATTAPPSAAAALNPPRHISIESRMRSPVPIRRISSFFATQPRSDHQTSATAAPPSAATTLNRSLRNAAESRLRSRTPAVRWTPRSPDTRPRSDRSDSSEHSATATAVLPPAAATLNPPPHHADEFHLWELSPQEKGRRLIDAAWQGAVEELEALLAVGADVAATDDCDRGTALHWAARGGHVEATRRLLAAGAAVGARGAVGRWTPLHWAAGNGRAGVVRLLLAAGADHGDRSDDGETPLHLAAYWGHADAAAALLDAGADRTARDSGGRTPLDVARQRRRHQLAELLQAGAGPARGTAP